MYGHLAGNQWRFVAIILLFASSTIGLILRVGYVQLFEHDYYRQKAAEEHWGNVTISPQRGAVRDTNGRLLATTVTVYNVQLDPTEFKSPEKLATVAKTLSPLVNVPVEKIIADAALNQKFVLKEGLGMEQGEKISSLDLTGVRTTREIRRAYPEGNLAAQVIGFVGRDNRGLSGLEKDFNGDLVGKSGTLVYERDPVGGEIPLGYRQLTPPEEGADLVLTIDRFAQRIAEKELDEALTRHKASGGTIIVMDPKTGAILALANRPTYNLQEMDLSDPSKMQLYRNRAITDMYEPGSTFKIITMAAGIEDKKIVSTTTHQCKGFVMKFGWPIRTWDGGSHGVESMADVLKNSCNVGAVYVSDLLGKERFYQYLTDFGFGQKTNVDLNGEAFGQLRTYRDENWWPIDLATNSFGQGLNVTPLQMITAVSAVANGGELMKPYIVKQTSGPDGTRNFQPVVIRRVLSPETTKMLIGMLTHAVEKGETKLAAIPGYHVAGKTGTAQISLEKGYTTNLTIASFIGMAPAEDPQFVILVKIDEPKDQPWGGLVASPIFKKIAEQLLIYNGIPPADPALASGKKT